MLFAGDPVSSASDAGGRDGGSYVVHERCGMVERGRGTEIVGRFRWRPVADTSRFVGKYSVKRIERDGACGFAGKVRGAGS